MMFTSLEIILMLTNMLTGILAGLQYIPKAADGVKWIVKRTKTKKDDKLFEDITRVK